MNKEKNQNNVMYDYKNQAWVVNGKYIRCGHQSRFGIEPHTCDCYGRLHQGEEVKSNSDLR